MKESKVILCTGGIGSGKSFVMRALAALGVPAFDTDACAKRLYDTCPELVAEVAKVAGAEVAVDGHIDRKALSARIFADSTLMERVEAVVHPRVVQEFNEWKERQRSRAVAIESAILLQKPALRSIPDFVICVDAPLETRIARVASRDSLPREAILARIAAQQDCSAQADFKIETNDRQPILPALINILAKIENGEN